MWGRRTWRSGALGARSDPCPPAEGVLEPPTEPPSPQPKPEGQMQSLVIGVTSVLLGVLLLLLLIWVLAAVFLGATRGDESPKALPPAPSLTSCPVPVPSVSPLREGLDWASRIRGPLGSPCAALPWACSRGGGGREGSPHHGHHLGWTSARALSSSNRRAPEVTATVTRPRGCCLVRGLHLPPSDVCGDVRGPLTTRPQCAPWGWRRASGLGRVGCLGARWALGLRQLRSQGGPEGLGGRPEDPVPFLGPRNPPKPQLTTAGPWGSLTRVLLCRGLRPQEPRPTSGECPSLCITVN